MSELLRVLDDIACKPYYLHLELTNLCNANCVFCAYEFQKRENQFMPEHVFEKAVSDFLSEGGGSVTLTPIVGDALIDPNFLKRVERLRRESHVDRIRVITNGILLDRFGIANVVYSGINFLAFSVPGFDADIYERVFRSKSYERMRDNLLAVLKENDKAGRPIEKISVLIRSDRPYEDLLRSPDFQEVLKYSPGIHFTRYFSSFIDRISPDRLPEGMYLFGPRIGETKEPCSRMYDSPVVLPDGTVLACDCYSAMDAIEDLAIGNILERPLGDIWRGNTTLRLREGFTTGALNETCSRCDNYQNLDMYRNEEGITRARLNRMRKDGGWERRGIVEDGFWLNP